MTRDEASTPAHLCPGRGEEITHLLDDELPSAARTALEDHLTECGVCQAELESRTVLRARMSEALTLRSLPQERAALAAAARRSLPGDGGILQRLVEWTTRWVPQSRPLELALTAVAVLTSLWLLDLGSGWRDPAEPGRAWAASTTAVYWRELEGSTGDGAVLDDAPPTPGRLPAEEIDGEARVPRPF